MQLTLSEVYIKINTLTGFVEGTIQYLALFRYIPKRYRPPIQLFKMF